MSTPDTKDPHKPHIIETDTSPRGPPAAEPDCQPYLHQKYDQKVEVGNSSELLEQVLGYEVPKRVLQQKGDKGTLLRSDGLPATPRGAPAQRSRCQLRTRALHLALLLHTPSKPQVRAPRVVFLSQALRWTEQQSPPLSVTRCTGEDTAALYTSSATATGSEGSLCLRMLARPSAGQAILALLVHLQRPRLASGWCQLSPHTECQDG